MPAGSGWHAGRYCERVDELADSSGLAGDGDGLRQQLVTGPPQPSRFFAVHPGWRYWQPPPAVVH